MWDIGGQESLRQAWSTYYSGTQFVILVVDSTDRDRLAVSREELYKMLGNDVSMGQSHETSLSCGFPPETESKLLSCNNNAELRTIDSLTYKVSALLLAQESVSCPDLALSGGKSLV